MDLSPEQLESIMRRLDFLRIEVGDIPRFSSMTQADYTLDRDRRRSLERLVENIVNANTDIAKIALSTQGLPVPDTYRDSMLQMGVAGLIEQELAERLAEMVRLRNILAHQYLDIRWEALRGFIRDGPAILQQFISAIEHLVGGNR